ncbi:serine/threonine-protein kinase [Saccharopolyspora montiporae]|uniref:serine/threonine-protein kinase n=1 Tax=Saccharopolyspora montiporae TaxID=2781240 RepID=UPI00351C5977
MQESGPEPGTGQQRLVGGRYRLLDELGRGGMGVVWRARDEVIGRDVALKELHPPETRDPEARAVSEERVLREVRTAGRLSDPGVVTVHDVLTGDGPTCIVMELVRAPTLAELVERDGPLPAAQVGALAEQLLSALDAAHRAGVVHRDVKPSNIMVCGDRVKLADFGIAQDREDPRLTSSGILVGSASFIAPERIRGADAAPASDLWSLGAVLFFALEGWMPYERPTTAATLHAVLTEAPRLSAPHGALGAVIIGLLVPDPDARLTAERVRALLAGTAGSGAEEPAHSVPGRVPGGTSRLPDPTRVRVPVRIRSRGRLIGAAALVGALLLGTAFALGRVSAAPDGGPEAMDPVLFYGEESELPAFELEAGQCGSGEVAAGAELTADAEADCAESHDFEVFTSGSPFGDDDVGYPGAEVLADYGAAFCASHFESDQIVFPGRDETLRFAALVPDEQRWDLKRGHAGSIDFTTDDEGSQQVHCVLYAADGSRLRTPATA